MWRSGSLYSHRHSPTAGSDSVHRSVPGVLLLLALAPQDAVPQEPGQPSGGWTFLPGTPLFPPLPASPEEPRVGLSKEIGSARMRLDIGATFDLLEYAPESDTASRYRVGADLFTYALTTSFQGLKLQVDAVDGYFGAHFVLERRRKESQTTVRLRILHLSSHFIDGHFRLENNTWVDGQLPRPYSRDAAEVTAAYTWGNPERSVMLYAGFSQAWFVRPADMRRFTTSQGVVAHTSGWIGPLWGQEVHLYLADHFALAGVGTLDGTNVLEAGLKVGAWQGRGVKIYISYHTGTEIYHQYFDVRRSDVGAGFTLDIW